MWIWGVVPMTAVLRRVLLMVLVLHQSHSCWDQSQRYRKVLRLQASLRTARLARRQVLSKRLWSPQKTLGTIPWLRLYTSPVGRLHFHLWNLTESRVANMASILCAVFPP